MCSLAMHMLDLRDLKERESTEIVNALAADQVHPCVPLLSASNGIYFENA